jgi:microcystin degradation protein MlrC
VKQLSVLIIAFYCLFGLSACQTKEKSLLRIAIAGLSIESSTFSPARSDEAAFHLRVGNDRLSYYPFLRADSPLLSRATWIPGVVGYSLPGGMVTRKAYESLVGRMIDSLKKNLPYDGLYFDIHGAMSVEGLDDPEGEMLKRIRTAIGYNTIVSTSMDLHGNVSEALAENTDLITCFRMAPHDDAMETKQRAVENLLKQLETGKGKPPFKALIPVPILLPGEKTSTRIEPGKSLYAAVAPASRQSGVTDAAIWIGYAWADEPRNHGVVMAYGDDKEKVKQAAEQLARRFWDARMAFNFVAPTLSWQQSLDTALSSKERPFFISDMGDNPTAGGAGDVSWTLTQLLSYPAFKDSTGPSVIYASLPASELVQQAVKVGVGNIVDGYAGAKVDKRFAPPVRVKGIVESIVKGDKDAEVEVSVRVGSIHVILTQKRKPYHNEIDFTNLGLNPRKTDIVVVKIGYLVPELYDMRAGWVMALTPGGVDQDIEHLPYKRINRPMFPFDRDMKDPDLSARFVPVSGSTRSK